MGLHVHRTFRAGCDHREPICFSVLEIPGWDSDEHRELTPADVRRRLKKLGWGVIARRYQYSKKIYGWTLLCPSHPEPKE